jgi:hypothetical protein
MARASERLRGILAEACPGLAPSPELRRRIAGIAAQHDAARGRRGRRWRLPLGLASASVAALAALLFVNLPTLVAAHALRRMEAAVSDVRSAHMVTWSLMPDRHKAMETWYQAGRWRLEGLGRIQVYRDGRLWTYLPDAGVVRVRRQAVGPFSYNPSGFSVGAILHEGGLGGWPDPARIVGSTRWNGRPARQLLVNLRTEPGRLAILEDAATDLPIRMEAQRKSAAGWVPSMVWEFSFDEPLPAALFRPEFPRAARLVDFDAEQRRWGERLARGLARQAVGDRTLVIRDLQVNREGDLFLLYSAGKFPIDSVRDWSVKVADDLGTRYVRVGESFQATMDHDIPNIPKGYRFDGERMEGDWWVPLEPQRPWKPRRITISFKVAPVNRHGEQFGWPLSLPATFNLPVERPECLLLPEYIPYMPFGVTEWQARRAAAEARARTYRYQDADPERALACYQEIIRIAREESAALSEWIPEPHTWLSIYEIERDQGRRTEARAALMHAREEDTRGDLRQQIEKALREGN